MASKDLRLTGSRMNLSVYLNPVLRRVWSCRISAHISSVITITVTSTAANPGTEEREREGEKV